MNTIKCLFCNNIFCVDHYPIHKTYHEQSKEPRKNAGALITPKDIDYNKPCIVCITITQYTINNSGDIVKI